MKQVIIVNESLKLPRGKLAAQVAHAAVAGFLVAGAESRQAWIDAGMPKIVLAAKDDQEVMEFYQKAIDAKLPAYFVRDAGKTVLAPGTITCVGIGPAPEADIDQLSGNLKLVG